MFTKTKRIEIAGNYTVAKNGCWLWNGKLNEQGYGYAGDEGAHRRAYKTYVGPIPNGLCIDHTCHDPDTCICGPACEHRRCVNPDHLEVVTPRENFRRGKLGRHLPPDWA